MTGPHSLGFFFSKDTITEFQRYSSRGQLVFFLRVSTACDDGARAYT